VREAIGPDRWVMDGNYGGTMALRFAAADTAIFLDVPRLTCMWRVVRRSLRPRGRTRPDVGPGCPERLPDREFATWIWTYPSRRRADVLHLRAELERRGGRAVVLRSTRDVHRFLDALPSAPGARPAAVSIAGK
jgi:adenylate kinase family enzyme